MKAGAWAREEVKAASLESPDMMDGWMDGWVCILIATFDASASVS